MFLDINTQQIEWLEKELEIMIDEYLSGKCPRSQFAVNTMRSLLAKIKETDENN